MNDPEGSSPESVPGNEELIENLEKTVKFQDMFLERETQIEKTLQQIANDNTHSDSDEIVDLLNISLSGIGETDEEITKAAFGFYHLIMERRPDAADILEDLGAKEKFIENILNWTIDYSSQLRRINFRKSQGSRWWSSYNMERILREEGISHRHKFTIDQREEVTIDSVPRSDWAIIYTLLYEFVESYKISNNELSFMTTPTALNNTRRLIYQIEEMAEEEGLELPSRDELLEMENDQS